MKLFDYRNFLINDSILNEASTAQQLEGAFLKFKSDIGKDLTDLKNFVRTSLASELGPVYTGLISGDNYVTVYDTIIKIRSSQGSRLAEFAKTDKKSINEVFNGLLHDLTPSNRFEKAVSLVMFLMDEAPDTIVWAPKDSLAKETIALNGINASLTKIKNDHGAVRILLSSQFYQKSSATAVIVDRVDKVDGTPKADFQLIDENGASFVFISHKDGKTAKDFQQYGGVSDEKLRNHPEVVEFLALMKEVSKDVDNDFSKLDVREYAVPIKDPKLAEMAMFGNDVGGSFSIDNVQLVMQGDIILDPIKSDEGEGCYALNASGHVMLNPALTGNKLQISSSDSYWPCLYVSFRTGMGGSYGFKNARFFIWPLGNNGTIRGLKNTEEWKSKNT